MPIRRPFAEGGSYFFTVVTHDRQPLLTTEIESLRNAFGTVLSRHPFTIEAIVVLPDHLHTIWRMREGDSDYSKRWRVLKRLFSTSLPANPGTDSQRRRKEKGVWQRRFWEHALRDDEDWQRHIDYIHYNPVKHGLCAAPCEWPYSSFKRFVARGWYDQDWGTTEPQGIPTIEVKGDS